MKLLVLAQTPPPLHGQSLMVQMAVDGLPQHGIEVHHVNLRLSRSHADIGGWRPGKILAVLDACFHAIVTRFTHGCDTLYYVPAPAKRGALYRDWILMALCRPFFPRLVLHFHNGGLAEWIAASLTAPERAMTRLLLGRADLAIVQADALKPNAEALAAKRIETIPNGIPDPKRNMPIGSLGENRTTSGPLRVLFLGLCSEEKGLFSVLEAVRLANAQSPGGFQLDIAGVFPDRQTEERFRSFSAGRGDVVFHGFAGAAVKHALFTACDCLCLPTRYPHEAQPLVLLDALAYDRPVVASRWRAIAETLNSATGRLVAADDNEALSRALLDLRRSPVVPGACRAHFEANFTRDRHLSHLATALRKI